MLVLVAGVVATIFIGQRADAAFPGYWTADIREGFDLCKEHTLPHLNAPSTAVFSEPLDEATRVTGGVSYLLAIYRVEAENALGGRVTQEFWCSLVRDESGEWELEYVKLPVP